MYLHKPNKPIKTHYTSDGLICIGASNLIYGETNSGKSEFAKTIALQLCLQGYAVTYFDLETNYNTLVKKGWNNELFDNLKQDNEQIESITDRFSLFSADAFNELQRAENFQSKLEYLVKFITSLKRYEDAQRGKRILEKRLTNEEIKKENKDRAYTLYDEYNKIINEEREKKDSVYENVCSSTITSLRNYNYSRVYFIDNLEKLIPNINDQQQMSTIIERINNLCIDNDCTIVFAHHTSKGIKSNERCTTAHAKGCGTLVDLCAQCIEIRKTDAGEYYFKVTKTKDNEGKYNSGAFPLTIERQTEMHPDLLRIGEMQNEDELLNKKDYTNIILEEKSKGTKIDDIIMKLQQEYNVRMSRRTIFNIISRNKNNFVGDEARREQDNILAILGITPDYVQEHKENHPEIYQEQTLISDKEETNHF